MSFENNGIRRVEIHSKTNPCNISDDIWTDDDSEFDAKVDNINEDRKKEAKKIPKKKEENVKLDSLLKAVIDIGDQLQEHEDNIQRYEQKYPLSNNTDKYFPPKHFRPKTAVLRSTTNDRKQTRPKTAVLRYKEPVNFEESEMDNISSISTHDKLPFRHQSNSIFSESNRVDFPSRVNMSFDNNQVRRIDMENQRLLKELLRTKATKESIVKKKGPVRVQSASEINRVKRQQDIEKDNLRFLNKLQNVKPTSSLSRSTLLNEHAIFEQASSRLSRSGKMRPSSAPLSRLSSSRPSSARSEKRINYDTESLSSVSRSSRKSSFNGELSDFQKLKRQRQWNEVW